FADGASYDPASSRWTVLPPGPLSARSGATAIWDGSQVVMLGGYGADGALVDGATFDPTTRHWRSLPGPPPTTGLYQPSPGRTVSIVAEGTTAAWTGTELLAWPGYEIRSQSTSSLTISAAEQSLSWKPGSSRWVVHQPRPKAPPYGAAAFWTGHQLLFFAGSTCPPDFPCPPLPAFESLPVWSYAPSTGRWRTFAGSVVLAGAGPLVWTGRAVVAIDGSTQVGSGAKVRLEPGDAAAFAPSSDRWLDLPPYPYGALYNASAIWTGRAVIVWGGVYRGPSNGGELS
ncbi:MAG TPA: hypothetical protein VED63_02765, partial [Acidimicrobiales bacterium]|nr:hypothetical protein [Acidimicrobiales bacterium]